MSPNKMVKIVRDSLYMGAIGRGSVSDIPMMKTRETLVRFKV